MSATGSYYQVPLVENPLCSDPTALAENAYLTQVCACEAGVNSAINASNTYVAQVEKYNADFDAYNKAKIKETQWINCSNGYCEGAYGSYQTEFNATKDEIRTFKNCAEQYSAIRDGGQYCTTDHGSGWMYIGEGDTCKLGSSPPDTSGGIGRSGECQRSLTKAQEDWKIIFARLQPQPPVPAQPTPPKFTNTSAITCCSIGFEDLESQGTLTISDISQNCSAEVNTAINYASTVPTGALPPNYNVVFQRPNGTPASFPIYAIVLIVVVAAVVLGLVIYAAVTASKRKKERASLDSALDARKKQQMPDKKEKASLDPTLRRTNKATPVEPL